MGHDSEEVVLPCDLGLEVTTFVERWRDSMGEFSVVYVLDLPDFSTIHIIK